MSNCKYCGQDAGWLKSEHKECKQRFVDGSGQIADIMAAVAKGLMGVEAADRQVDRLAKDSFVSHVNLRQLALDAYGNAVNSALSDDILTQDEEDRLAKFSNSFGLTNIDVSDHPAHMTIVKAAVLRDLMEGKVPDRVKLIGTMPFNFQKSESLVWVFQGVEYLQPRTQTTYRGKSSGVSIRVMKGVYYRTGQFAGNPIVKTQITAIDNGTLAATTKHIYFSGGSKSFRIRYDKIVAFNPFSDGIAVQRDGAAKIEYFVTGDGWFTYNLLMNLAQV